MKWSGVAAGTTLNVMGFPAPANKAPPEPVAEAVIVIEPARLPVSVMVATPATAGLDPRPETVPAPPVFANDTLRALSAPAATVLPLAS